MKPVLVISTLQATFRPEFETVALYKHLAISKIRTKKLLSKCMEIELNKVSVNTML